MDGLERRLARIADKLATVRAGSELPPAFGAQVHRFQVRAPMSEAALAGFEARHQITLPDEYRSRWPATPLDPQCRYLSDNSIKVGNYVSADSARG